MAYTWQERKRLERYVASKVCALQDGYIKGRSAAKALLARLRGAASKYPGETAETWEFEFGGLPASLAGSGDLPATEGEWATHIALTLYAVHQQSKNTEMHRQTVEEDGVWFGLGSAAKRFASLSDDRKGEELEQGEMPRRFAALVTAESVSEVGHYARQLVQQFKNVDIPLDYGRLAGQLYEFQFPYRKKHVVLEWAREFSKWNDSRERGEEK